MKVGKITVLLMAVLLLTPWTSAYSVSSLVLTVYEDGYVKVEYEITPEDYESQIGLPLPGGHYENFIVEDSWGNPVNFKLNNDTLIVYPGGASVVRVSYYTPDLTSKRGIVWTLQLNSSYSFTVVLPEGAVVVDLSEVPLEIAGSSITMPPGNQSVSYTFQERPYRGGSGDETTVILVLGILTAGAVGVGLVLWLGRGRRKSLTEDEFRKRLESLELTEEEKRALLYLFGRGGRASQAEVREAIGLPKTTAWRMFRRLERKGLVRILKGKKENWVELKL
ncbi:hypothetical protein CL1_0111 [Thermococcus cleftensis]|uniref:Transcription regulator TrmB N-terminal domain-containing protein n=1 Tax=Thermococcus cleftensis (strain DSM 27260 / KACC 17922 / CL1) TaxID=163003 RepID=I3ZRJ2_THECF|nr:helix-turn-helix domain-containing protein [Thermococcus cleftensis]AFL94326.1 hypothetical protein CL1_0111 [Thermococcus cleftensis]